MKFIRKNKDKNLTDKDLIRILIKILKINLLLKKLNRLSIK